MFERFFQWSLKHGPRVLFVVAVIMLLVGVLQSIGAVAATDIKVRTTTHVERLLEALATSWPQSLPYLVAGLSGASLPFFCGLVVQRVDLWLQKGDAVAVAASPPPSGWLSRHGARLLLVLSLLYLLSAAITLVVAVQQSMGLVQIVFFQGAWLGPLWNSALLLFASLALDRIDRWLATFRPYSD